MPPARLAFTLWVAATLTASACYASGGGASDSSNNTVAAEASPAPTRSEATITIAAAAAFAAVVAFACGAAVCRIIVRRAARDAHAPRDESNPIPVAIVTLNGLTALHLECEASANEARDALRRATAAAAAETRCYVAAPIGDALVVTASDSRRVVSFLRSMQRRLPSLTLPVACDQRLERFRSRRAPRGTASRTWRTHLDAGSAHARSPRALTDCEDFETIGSGSDDGINDANSTSSRVARGPVAYLSAATVASPDLPGLLGAEAIGIDIGDDDETFFAPWRGLHPGSPGGESAISVETCTTATGGTRSEATSRARVAGGALQHRRGSRMCRLQLCGAAHAGHGTVTHDPARGLFDYRGDNVADAAAAADFALRAGTLLVTEAAFEDLDAATAKGLVEACEVRLRSSGSIPVYALDALDAKALADAAEKATAAAAIASRCAPRGGESEVLAAVDAQAGSLAAREVAALAVHVGGAVDLASPAENVEGATAAWGGIVADVADIAAMYGGRLHSATGTDLVVLFNAHLPANAAAKRAVACGHALCDALDEHDAVTFVTCGVACGRALVGATAVPDLAPPFSLDGASRGSFSDRVPIVLGDVVSRAVEAEATLRRAPRDPALRIATRVGTASAAPFSFATWCPVSVGRALPDAPVALEGLRRAPGGNGRLHAHGALVLPSESRNEPDTTSDEDADTAPTPKATTAETAATLLDVAERLIAGVDDAAAIARLDAAVEAADAAPCRSCAVALRLSVLTAGRTRDQPASQGHGFASEDAPAPHLAPSCE